MTKGNALLQNEYLGPTRVPTLLSFTPDSRRKPLVILAPGGGNQGIDNAKELLAETLSLDGTDFFKAYVDLPLHGERAANDLGRRFRTDQVSLFLHPVVMGMAREIIHVIDALITRDDVDPTRVGVCGWSLGGQASLIAAATDKRIKAAVGISIPYNAEQGPQVKVPDSPEHAVMKTELDVLPLAARIYPTAVLLVHGARDTWVTPESSRRLSQALKPHYAGRPERLRYVEYSNMAHNISHPDDEACAADQGRLKQEVAAWLKRFLRDGAVPAA